ncbi:MAG: metallophosphoesterase [Planctomycetes bacterium]|nr:metallophosphoesterase [Planctomycetota bacterium]
MVKLVRTPVATAALVALPAVLALAAVLPYARERPPRAPAPTWSDTTVVAGLLHAAPMAGRARGDAIELQLLTATRPVALQLFVAAEPSEPSAADAAAPLEQPVAFGELRTADPAPRARHLASGSLAAAGASVAPLVLPADAAIELSIEGLAPGVSYRWRCTLGEADAGERHGAARATAIATGRFVTARPRGAPFRFVVFSDTHVFPAVLEPELPPEVARDEYFLGMVMESLFWYRTTRERVAAEAAAVFERMDGERPDFAVSLGDVFDLHGRGFNWAFPAQEMADAAHLEARRALTALNGAGSLFQVLGNWEGESGCHPDEPRRFARLARQRHTVNPRPATSRVPGSPDEDYYAFEWGDLLGIALNVRGYTPTVHHLDPAEPGGGKPDDFTLGAAQKQFLEATLAQAEQPYRALFLHHVVGGNAGNPADSAYGRGGGRAAHVGEQEWVHQLCRRHGVQVIFYGHDHVFTDLEVDGIHYTLPGTTSAPWRFSAAETGYDRFWTDSGYARVDVAPAQMSVEFVNLAGELLFGYTVAPNAK